MGNTLGALTFLAAGTWLGWKVVQGQAQNFLAAMSRGSSSSGGGGNGNPALRAPLPPAGFTGALGTALSGIPSLSQAIPGDPFAGPIPNVFGDVFGQNGALGSPQYTSPYAPAFDPTIDPFTLQRGYMP